MSISVIDLCRSCMRSMRFRRAYTLVEILVVLFVLMLLAAIALPTVKDLLTQQKYNRAASNLVAFIGKARSRAIAEQRSYGVLIERGVGGTLVDDLSLSQSIRVRQISGIPPYSGDASDAYAILDNIQNDKRLGVAEFLVRDNQLLHLSAQKKQEGRLDEAPIRDGDLLELPGGRMIPIVVDPNVDTSSGEEKVRVFFSLVDLYPDGSRDLSSRPRVKYRIHRHPVVSAVTPFSMPRGVVIDLNFSGVGVDGNQFGFNPTGLDSNIEILFGPDGSVQQVTKGNVWQGNELKANQDLKVPPLGSIFLCVGDSDGLVSSQDRGGLFSEEKKSRSNLLNLESIWVTVNPYTGRCNASPMAPLNGVPAYTLPDPHPVPTSNQGLAFKAALTQSRYFATLSDSVDPE